MIEKKKTLGLFVFVSLFLFADKALAGVPLLIYGSSGDGSKGIVFLGCINCEENDRDSLANKFGKFGDGFSPTSIYNQFGHYGSDSSNVSVCNRTATKPPVIFDEKGNFQAHLTLNRSFAETAVDPRTLGACR